jgi:hypothetical protein
VRDDGEGAAAADFLCEWFGHRGRIPVDCAAFYRLAARHAIDLDPARVKAWSMIGTDVFTVTRGMRIAQLVIAPVVQARIVVHDSLSETVRGSGGFGSTGTA